MKKNKKYRLLQQRKKYIRRLHLYAACLDVYITKDGKRIYKPKWIDVLNDGGVHRLKTMSTMCSCAMCSPHKYSRKVKHRNCDPI